MIDTDVSHSPRIWNYWLGGKDNYQIDREVGDQFARVFPDIVPIARASRWFLTRAVEFLAGEAGIRQFLDIGTGLPTVDNTHEVAQRVAPESRIVYVDNDPIVLAHARALLVSTSEGVTQYIDADLREPGEILRAAAETTLDFSQPVALMLLNVLGHIPDIDEARSIVSRLVDALPSGSYLAVADGTNVIRGEEFEAAIAIWNASGSVPYHLRTPEQIAGFFDGLELLEPGVVSCPLWRPHPFDIGSNAEVDEFCGVARKP
ncbi:SAM-dependent methyltransferase [Streptosporangium sp. NPDC000396]|uniref:SAM-dependent methyltransferase n=1 Tax=Streptosporangium sp. NPDC000396 TaxID=3366185 RepID=UPI0036B4B774